MFPDRPYHLAGQPVAQPLGNASGSINLAMPLCLSICHSELNLTHLNMLKFPL